eukprot:EG_transcript_17548
MSHQETAALLKSHCTINVSDETSASKSCLLSKIIRATGVACICLGSASIFSGVGCAAGLDVCVFQPTAAPQQLFSVPRSVAIRNSLTGKTFVLSRPSTALKASKVPPAYEKAAKLAITGMLSAAAVANPAIATEQEDRLAELMKAWNEEYGAAYGQWDMSGYRTAIKEAPKVAKEAAPAPDIKISRKATQTLDPIDQVMAEWNKEYGSQYGTWDMSGYRPTKKAAAPAPAPAPVPAPAPAPVAPAPVPAPVVPEPVKPEAPAAVLKEEEPAKVEAKVEPKVEAPVVKEEAPVMKPLVKLEAAPVPVPAPEAPAKAEEAEPSEGSPLALVAGGVLFVAAGVLAATAPTGSEEQKPAAPT